MGTYLVYILSPKYHAQRHARNVCGHNATVPQVPAGPTTGWVCLFTGCDDVRPRVDRLFTSIASAPGPAESRSFPAGRDAFVMVTPR